MVVRGIRSRDQCLRPSLSLRLQLRCRVVPVAAAAANAAADDASPIR